MLESPNKKDHVYTTETKKMSVSLTPILNGVSAIDGTSRFIIHNTKLSEKGILGVCSTKEEAILIVKNAGRAELDILKENTNEVWTKIIVEHVEGALSYEILTQALGYLKNGSIESYIGIIAEEVPEIYPSEYIEKIDNAEKPIEEQKDAVTPGATIEGEQTETIAEIIVDGQQTETITEIVVDANQSPIVIQASIDETQQDVEPLILRSDQPIPTGENAV